MQRTSEPIHFEHPRCAHCGHHLRPDGPLAIDVDLGEAAYRGHVMHVPPRMRDVLSVLNSAYPLFLKEGELRALLNGPERCSKSTLRTCIHSLRCLLRSERFPAQIIAEYGYGYRLEVGDGK
jgi:DNA-binding winged helix-turn-helix (wHTH) protein